MKKVLYFIVPLSILLFSLNVNAVLLDRGGGMIYDTDLNITWLKDANYAQTSGYDADGMMTWFSAKSWAENLVYGGYDDWRLPSAINQDGTGPYWAYRWEPHITGSELGHLYYVELGNSEPLTNTGPFLNMQNSSYWFGTEYVPTPELEAIRLWDSNTYGMPFIPATDVAWEFAFHNSEQLAHNSKSSALLYAWAVRDGDVDICITPPTNLISWWTGDGSTNDIVDGNHGTLQGGASFGAGLVGQAFSFDGVDDFVQVPDSDLWAFTSDFTIEMWVNFNSDPGGTLIHPGAIFISNTEGGGELNKWSFQLGEEKLAFHINGPAPYPVNGYFLAQADFSPTLYQWYHLSVTRSGNIYTIYINGISAGSETNDVVIPNPNAPLTIGQGEGFFLDGLIDEAAIYNRALSPSEIASIYNAGSAGKCKGTNVCITAPLNLVSWWPGDNNTNDIVDGNHGTLQGGASFGAGLVGQAFSFDGVDDFVMVPDNPSLNFGTNDFTFDFWVKFNTTEGEQILIEKFVSSPPATGWTLTKLAGNVIRFANDNPAGWVGLIIDVTPPSIPTDTWIFVAVTRNGNTYKVYWDGVAIGETTLEANLNLDTTSSLKFGHRGNPIDTPGSIDTGGYYLHGLIDEVEIYNRALSPSEIESIYNAGSAGKCKSPDISVSPTSYDFGSVNVGTSSSPQTFTISNTGTADLIVSSIDLSDITNYTIDKTGCGILPATITPGNNCTVTVTFSPSSTGTKNATLTITSDDPDTLTLNVSLSGIGVQQCFSNLNCNSGYYCKKPEGSCYSTGFCSVRPDSCTFEYLPVCGCNGLTYSNECVAAQSGVSVAYQGECVVPPTIGYSPTTFSFTATQGGSNPPSQNLSITNTGGGTLNWSVSDDATWLNLSPLSGSDSGTVTLSVDIAGLTVGTYNGTITITAAGSTNTPVNIPVTLTVNAPPAATLTLLVPNGGDVLPSGGIYAICWQAPSNAVKSDLSYSTDNGGHWIPIKTVTGLNCTHWDIPVVTVNKKQCRVKVIGYDSNSVKVGEDISDKPFTIEVLRIISPNGGGTLKPANTWTIRWVTNKTIRPVAKTVLKYTTDGTNWKPIKTLTGNPGNFNWKVPAASSTKCKVKVILKDTNGANVGTDVSDKFFTIQP